MLQLLWNQGCTFFLPGAVSRAGDDLTIAKETTAGQITWEIQETGYEKP